MRLQFPIVLILTVFFSGWYFYKNAPPCIAPLPYRLGLVDERFGLGTEDAKEIVASATQVWEDAQGRELFRYDDDADFTINFIYDERQERSELAEAQKKLLDKKEQDSKTIGLEYDRLVATYDALKKDYDAKVASYSKRLDTFNATVSDYNKTGGAPPTEYAKLQATEKSLKREEVALEQLSTKLTAVADSINEVSAQGNAVIAEYNANVSTYNQKFTGGEEFTQGDYKGTLIDVYHYSDTNELKNVLVHEFGHAIGLPHVEGSASIMYYLMDKQPTTSELSPEDVAALGRVCQGNDAIGTRFHQFVYPLFIKLNVL